MTLPSCTTAMATPGTFHCFMALAARSSRPWSFEAGDAAVAAAAGAAGFFLAVWAKLGEVKNIADKNTARVGLRMIFLSVMPSRSEFDAQAELALATGQIVPVRNSTS